MSEASAGWQPGFIAIGVPADDSLTFWVLTQQQMDDLELEAAKPGIGDYTEAVNVIVDRYQLFNGARFGTIKDALKYMMNKKLILEEDFTYVDY